jgi:hypothetical protein
MLSAAFFNAKVKDIHNNYRVIGNSTSLVRERPEVNSWLFNSTMTEIITFHTRQGS